ncbi:MAG TPA: chemotaxis-specific protein-glutamate methyltransferase CheB [Acidobacteriota bacterium]|nr:chemotaxis-specific protein-glutamate methyltransferase CheB [Acidobacteriota bacterium]
MINVLIADDSPATQMYLQFLLEQDGELSVVGLANDGRQAISLTSRLKPDVIVMDIHMPGVNGFEATRILMQSTPLPIVIVTSAYDPRDSVVNFQALEAGALTLVGKPTGLGHPKQKETSQELIATVKAAARARLNSGPRLAPGARPAVQSTTLALPRREPLKILAIGASTGGPPVIRDLIQRLIFPFPAPILIVQHITAGFIEGFRDWLAQTTNWPVHMATHHLRAHPGTIYLAPDDHHLTITPGFDLVLKQDVAEHSLRPAVSVLFRSIAQSFGSGSAGVLLTGMGKDGAQELRLIRDRGGITFAQDQATSVVFGMPGEAVKLKAATHVLPPEEIAGILNLLVKGSFHA